MSSSGGFVLDTPQQIEAFALLQVYYKLKLEAEHPGGPRFGYSPMKQAIAILERSGRPTPHRRKKTVLADYEAALIEAGILRPKA